MTLTISQTDRNGGNFNADFAALIAGFTPTGWLHMLGGTGQFNGSQIVLLGPVVKGREAETKVMVIDGRDMAYNYDGHTLSGTMTGVRLGVLGDSYNPATDEFTKGADGLISKITVSHSVTGFKLSNKPGEAGDFHKTVYALMGHSAGGGAPSDGQKLFDAMASERWSFAGTAGDDRIEGTRFGDTLAGAGGNDSLYGGAGHDRLEGGAGNDSLVGGAGNDSLYGGAGNDRLFGGAGADLLEGGAGNDRLIGGEGRDTLYGGAGNDRLEGGAGMDVLDGGAGRDTLIGGGGQDRLTGGGGADVFVFVTANDSLVKAPDTITDFTFADGDRIDLSGLGALHFAGRGALSGTEGEVRALAIKTGTQLRIDLDGDGTADMAINLTGVAPGDLTADAFLF